MAIPAPGLLGTLALVVALFLGSTLVSAGTLRREIREAAQRKQPPPDIAGWWETVVRWRAAILGAGSALALAGAGALAAGLDAPGRALVVLAVCVFCYLAQAHALTGVARRARR